MSVLRKLLLAAFIVAPFSALAAEHVMDCACGNACACGSACACHH
jgi:hypothetical protein